jgi:hypothetical protein
LLGEGKIALASFLPYPQDWQSDGGNQALETISINRLFQN